MKIEVWATDAQRLVILKIARSVEIVDSLAGTKKLLIEVGSDRDLEVKIEKLVGRAAVLRRITNDEPRKDSVRKHFLTPKPQDG